MTLLTPHQKAALDYSRHISLTANAGSGKTFVLSKRYLEIALNENVPLRNIAAITFTEKAAGELYKKISADIDKLFSETTNESILKKLEKIRRQLVSANISTIHSFCIDILREYPVEAQLDANFTPIDETDSDELIEMAIEEVIRELMSTSGETENLKYLVRLFSSKMKLSSETASLIKNRKNVIEAVKLYEGSAPEVAAFFHKSFLKAAGEIISPSVNKFITNITILNNAVLENHNDNQTALEVKYLLEKLLKKDDTESLLLNLFLVKEQLLTGSGTLKKRGYLTGALRESLDQSVDEAEDFLKEYEDCFLPDNYKETELELASAGQKLSHFFQLCLERYDAKKKEEGFLDYEDLLIFTKRIIENKQVQQSLSEKFRYIMVDEYQDTNDIQYGIFLPILDYLKKNNLFVVGDEKQSIYMFRDAELEVFSRTKNDIINMSGESSLLTLPDTFRMAPALCLFTNALFRNLFSEVRSNFNEVEHSEIICARNDEVKGNIEILVVSKEQRSEEADLIARRLVNLASCEDRKYKWGDIAVLCRKRKSFADLEEAFVKYGIPYSIIGGKGFYQRQSVYDVFNYFAFLLDTQNDAALAGILRSPFFNLSDAELYKISLARGSSYWQKFIKYTAQEEHISDITGILQENLLLSRNYDLTFLLRKILNETGYFALLASGVNGEQETANMNKLIRLTTNFFSHGYKTLYDYVNFLKDAIKSEEDEAQAAVSDESDSVKIMTIHQAKGLEYPVVVLYKSDESSKSSAARSKEIMVDKNFGLLTKVPLNNDYFKQYAAAPILNLSSYISKKKNLAEIKRLFYVAVTRAKDMLIISSIIPDRKKDDSFTGLLHTGLDIDFSSEGFALTFELKFLLRENELYKTLSKTMSITIPVIKDITVTEQSFIQETDAPKNLIKDLSIIPDAPEGEIISATKYSVYKQCPVKYNLIYEYGFSELFNAGRLNRSVNIITDEEEDHIPAEEINITGKYADIKGSIIHRILQQEIIPSELTLRGKQIIDNELKNLNITPAEKESMVNTIVYDLEHYFQSSGYGWIKKFPSYYNEYNIYLQEKDYFLFGILDKLIITDKKAYIVDYKTDDIDETEIPVRSAKYFNQLKFYSYIIKSSFKSLAEIELRLIFLKNPSAEVLLNPTADEIRQTGEEISEMVKEIRAKRFIKNYEHCSICHFNINKTGCIII